MKTSFHNRLECTLFQFHIGSIALIFTFHFLPFVCDFLILYYPRGASDARVLAIIVLSSTPALNPERRSTGKSKTKTGRLASPASNPLVTVPNFGTLDKRG